LSILFDLERTNQLSLLPDKDLVDLCLPIEPYQVTKSQTYQESISIEQYKLESNKIGSVRVAPGQKRREDTWDDLLRTLVGGKIKLIIHVVSWGYHSFGEFSYTQHQLYQSGMTLEEFLREYAAVCRNRELDVLRRIEPH
jgi:hypothetical protein